MARSAAPKRSLIAEYVRHVGKHYWFLVAGVVGGVLAVLSLVTSIVVPLWLGIVILVVGLLAAQFLAFRDMRQERDRAVKASEVSIGPSPFPRTKLESAVVRSLVAAEDIERERAVQGEGAVFGRLVAWAGDTDQRLEDAQAGELHVRFRRDGLDPPHGVTEQVAYLKRQIDLLEDALRQLRSDEGATAPRTDDAPAESAPESQHSDGAADRLAFLRERYQRGRALQGAPPWLAGPAPASPDEAEQGRERKRQATFEWAQPTWKMLREHFPPREDEFCPYGARWEHSDFRMAFEEELDAIYSSADAYLDKKLAFLADLLQEHDS